MIILSHFGIESQPLTLEEIGKKLGISRQRVKEIEKKAFYKIKKALKEKPQIFRYDRLKKIQEENQKMKKIFLKIGEVIFSDKEEKEIVEEVKKIFLSFLIGFLKEVPVKDLSLSKAFKKTLSKQFQSAGELAVLFEKRFRVSRIGEKKFQKIKEALTEALFQ